MLCLPLVSLFLSLLAVVQARSSTGNDVLVIIDSASQTEGKYSRLLNDLQVRGYDLFFREPKAEKPTLFDADTPQFHHVLLLASDAKTFAPDITPQSLVSLLTQNVNLLVALSPKNTPISTLAPEFGFSTPPPGTPLLSHFPERDDPLTVIPVPVSGSASPILSNQPGFAPVWFSGVPFLTSDHPFTVPILQAPPESFAADLDATPESLAEASEKGGEGLWAGSSVSLASGFQVVDGGRVVFLGGVDMLSDAYFEKALPSGGKPGNRKFAQEVTSWVFQERQVLRVDGATHHLVNGTEEQSQYTTNQVIDFEITVSQWNPEENEWEGYSELSDLQLDFTMLDPHVRAFLPSISSSAGKYGTTFRLPDRHGVYKFLVDYKRKGWTHLRLEQANIAVVPPRHDGYPRFLGAAWPYYAGSISTSVGFVVFSAIYLAGGPRSKGKKKME